MSGLRVRKGRYYSALSGAADMPQQWQAVEASEPARAASLASDVAVPILQSAFSGAVASAAAGMGAAWFLGTDPAMAARIAGAAGVAVLGLTWAALLADSRRLLWAIENLTGSDIDGDGVTGEPEPEPEPARLRLDVKHDGGERAGSWDFLTLPATEADFLTWARAALAGQSIAQSGWTGKAGLFSRSDYDSMLGELERAGLVRWVDPQNKPQGREVSPAGRAALRRLVESHARTHAHAGGYENAGAGGRGWGGAQ